MEEDGGSRGSYGGTRKDRHSHSMSFACGIILKGPPTSTGFKNEEEVVSGGRVLFLPVWAVWLLLDLSQCVFLGKKTE